MKGRDDKELNKKNAPGPGAYSPTALMLKSQTFSYFFISKNCQRFPKLERKLDEKPKAVPGPGTYNVIENLEVIKSSSPTCVYSKY